MTDKVFLTDSRRAVLNGEYDGEPNTERTHKSRIRSKARTALKELIEVAESDAIDNREVFRPDDMFALHTALMLPSHPDNIDPDGKGLIVGTTEEYQAYTDRLARGMTKMVLEDQTDE